jgi:hypothetical protein
MAVVINGDTGISPVTASGTSASVDGMTVGRGGGEVATNTAVGASALGANTTGANNTAIGNSSASAITTGVENVAIGSLSLNTATTASYNTVMGLRSAYSLTSATENVAIGYYSLNASTTGSTNVAVGASSLKFNTTGSSNAAFGHQALLSNTTASNNTAVGYQALYASTTGQRSVAFGSQAGLAITTGSYNTFLGEQAGLAATTSSGNTFIGEGSGQTVTTGASNTILGRFAGNQGGLNINTASNYIVLSDGDGNPKGYFGAGSGGEFTLNASASTAYNGILNFAEAGTLKTQQYYQKSVTSFYIVNSSAGVYLGSGATAWASASDERLKDIIEPITNGLTKVASLRTVIGKYKTDAEGTRRSFLIAQDVQAVLPEAISTTMVKDDETNTEYLGVSYTDVIPLLVAAIKELKAEFDAYKATHP